MLELKLCYGNEKSWTRAPMIESESQNPIRIASSAIIHLIAQVLVAIR